MFIISLLYHLFYLNCGQKAQIPAVRLVTQQIRLFISLEFRGQHLFVPRETQTKTAPTKVCVLIR